MNSYLKMYVYIFYYGEEDSLDWKYKYVSVI